MSERGESGENPTRVRAIFGIIRSFAFSLTHLRERERECAACFDRSAAGAREI